MYLQRKFKSCTLLQAVTVLVIMFACAPYTAMAQESDDDDTEAIDEIVAIGRKSLNQLRLEAYRAEDDFYALFNELNVDDEFDIQCFNETTIGSRIRRRTCRAKFESTANMAEFKNLVFGIPSASAAGVIMRKNKMLFDKMEQLAVQNPKLLDALVKYNDARQQFLTEHLRRCEGGTFSCER